MHQEKLQAFVLSSSDYGESDRIASLFTLEHGRIKGFARGARNSRKRFGPALESFARINLQLVRKESLSSLRQADVVTLYPGIRGSLGGIAHALYACELLECMTPEGQSLPRLYRLMSAYLERLDSAPPETGDRRMFEINLLNVLGYRPSLETCSCCGVAFDESDAMIREGGEPACRFCVKTGRRISGRTLQILRSCLSTGRFGSVQFGAEEALQAGLLLDEALSAHAGRKLKSLDFMRQAAL
jgi:DNA repair protein RecO (recombination protein O)